LVVAAIAVSLFGTILSLNKLNQGAEGLLSYTNDTGTTTVGVASLTTLRFAIGQNAIDFGSGSVNVSNNYTCTLAIFNATPGANINKSNGCAGFNNNLVNGSFVLENVGSTIMNVTLNFSSNASVWLGVGGNEGPLGNASLKFEVADNESPSCGTINATTAAWTEVVTATTYPVCTNLAYTPNTNSIKFGIMVAIPSTTSGNGKVLYIQANGIGS
jgi:hypothetical protein